jgi:hypothetical protein
MGDEVGIESVISIQTFITWSTEYLIGVLVLV